MTKRIKKSIKKIRLLYQQSSLQWILSVAFTVASVVVILLMSWGYSKQFFRSTERLMEENSLGVMDQVSLNLDSYLHDMMTISNVAYYNIIKEYDLYKDQDSIENKLSFLYKSNSGAINNIGIFREDGELIAAEPLNKLKKNQIVSQQEWFQKSVNKIENIHFSTPYVENMYYPENNTYHWVVSLSRSVDLTTKGATSSGVLVLNMNFKEIEKICENVNLGNSGYVYVIDSKGEIIYHPKQQLIYSGIMNENNRQAATYSEGSHNEMYQKENRRITVKTMGYSGWKIIGVTPVSSYKTVYTLNRQFVWLSTLVASICILLVNLFISSRVTTPIKNLDKAVSKIENDINNIDIPKDGTTEIRHLSATLESMTGTLRQLMDDLVEQEKKKRQTEMTVLQSQINPHFLYNTLDSTIWMIEMEKYDGAITMITSLARFFRISLSKGNYLITLEEEFEHVKSYLTIQSIRYKNKFTYTIILDDRIASMSTIKLIIQPIVENAIYHGMDYLFGDGELVIEAFLSKGNIYIEVTDNGPGMSEEQVSMLFSDHSHTGEKGSGSGIALKNIQERIQLYYGESYGIEVESERDEGTKVRIILPQISIEQAEKEL
ncbi:MAG: sensor histidine kinase [Vagococcus sp.]